MFPVDVKCATQNKTSVKAVPEHQNTCQANEHIKLNCDELKIINMKIILLYQFGCLILNPINPNS